MGRMAYFARRCGEAPEREQYASNMTGDGMGLRLRAACLCVLGLAWTQVGATAPPSAPSAALTTLQQLAGAGRSALIGGDFAVFDRLSAPPDDPGAWSRALSPTRRELLVAMLRQSVQYAGLRDAQQGITAWFDPFTDLWLVGYWSPAGRLWRLRSVALASSQELDPGNGGGLWYEHGATVAAALLDQGRRSAELFRQAILAGSVDALLRDPAHVSAGMDQLALRVIGLQQGLQDTLRRDGFGRYPHALADPLVRQISSVQDATVRDALQALPGAARASLQPVEAVGRPAPDAVRFAVQSPLSPARVFLVELARPASGGDAQAVRVEYIDLFSAVQ